MESRKIALLQEIRGVLRFHQRLGIGHYPQSEAVARFLRLQPPGSLPGENRPAARQAYRPGTPSQAVPPFQAVPQAAELSGPLTLGDIADEVRLCRACGLCSTRLYPVVGRGPVGARLMLVGDWLAPEKEQELPAGHLFGVRQDEMVAKMLAAIGLDPAEVYVTNVIKCAVPASCQPEAGHIATCLSFLRREIEVVAPALVCSMGMVATRTLLATAAPLSTLRGTFHPLPGEGSWRRCELLATYHPTFLLHNPEMKKATWADLQLLARRLAKV
jgi:uracil-DNA glycosylase